MAGVVFSLGGVKGRMMSDKNILENVPPEVLLKWARTDIDEAQAAQRKNKKTPELRFLAHLLINSDFDKVPLSIWRDLGMVLRHEFKASKGRPATKDKYITVARESAQLKASGVKSKQRIDVLREIFGYGTDRSLLLAVQKGDEFLKTEPKCKNLLTHEFAKIKYKKLTDKKD